jgi:hypothetical protein
MRQMSHLSATPVACQPKGRSSHAAADDRNAGSVVTVIDRNVALSELNRAARTGAPARRQQSPSVAADDQRFRVPRHPQQTDLLQFESGVQPRSI